MGRKGLTAGWLAGVLFLVTAYAQAAEPPQQVPPDPSAAGGDQEMIRVYLPLILRNHPPPPPVYALYVDPADLDRLARDPYSDERVAATFVHGRSWEVELRYRGDTARLMPKKSWKVFFPGGDPLDGQTELNLNADYVDQTLLRSAVGYDLFRRAGVPAPVAGFARLTINDIHYGLFSETEQIDERFLYRHGIEIHGNLYKPFYGGLHALDHIQDEEERAWWYRYYYPKKTNRQAPIDDVVALIETIDHTPDGSFPATIVQVLDVDGWLDWYAVNVLIGNFEMLEKNYYLYHDLSTDRWMVLPWDVDLAMGHDAWGPGIGGLLDTQLEWDNPIDSGTSTSQKYDGKWNRLIDRMMAVPEFRLAHCRRLKRLMADEFSLAEMGPRIDAAFQSIHPWAEADPYRWQPAGFHFSDGPGELKTYVARRITFLEGEMPGFCPDMDLPLAINEFMAANSHSVADEAGDYDDWFELYNASPMLAWELGGMYLTDDLDQPRKWQIPEGTQISPGGSVLFWADGEEDEGPRHTNFTLDAGGGQIGLFDGDAFGHGVVAVLTYTAQVPDVSYGRMPDGGGGWRYFSTPTPGWANQGRPPVVGGTGHTPASPAAGQQVTVATLIGDDGDVANATLWMRAFTPGSPPPAFQSLAMLDDGAHGDGSPGDGIYGTYLPGKPAGTWVEYTLEVSDHAGMVTVDRPGWPQGNYRYIVGWQRPPLRINEVMAINNHTVEDGDGDAADWIEIHNAGSVDVDLGGMFLSNNVGLTNQYTLPQGLWVPAGEYVVLWADDDPAAGVDHVGFKLSGAGEYVGLFDAPAGYYAPIDAVYFDPQEPDVSWGRFPDQMGSWAAMDTPTPGGPNRLNPPEFLDVDRRPAWPEGGQSVTVTAVITAGFPIAGVTLWYDVGTGFVPVAMGRASPGSDTYGARVPGLVEGTAVEYYLEAMDNQGQQTVSPAGAPAAVVRYLVGYTAPALRINEFLADNDAAHQDGAGEYDDWLELYNGDGVTAVVGGMYLTDDLSRPRKWQIPAGAQIPSGGYLVVWCDEDSGQGPFHASFKLSRHGEEIGLFADDGHGNVLVDQVTFGPQQGDVSSGRVPDGGGAWAFLDPPTPGESNGNW